MLTATCRRCQQQKASYLFTPAMLKKKTRYCRTCLKAMRPTKRITKNAGNRPLLLLPGSLPLDASTSLFKAGGE